MVLLSLTAAACVSSLCVAAYAWHTHFQWLRTGAYSHNSFPMGAFAVDASWFAGCVCLGSAVLWAIVLVRDRKMLDKSRKQKS